MYYYVSSNILVLIFNSAFEIIKHEMYHENMIRMSCWKSLYSLKDNATPSPRISSTIFLFFFSYLLYLSEQKGIESWVKCAYHNFCPRDRSSFWVNYIDLFKIQHKFWITIPAVPVVFCQENLQKNGTKCDDLFNPHISISCL